MRLITHLRHVDLAVPDYARQLAFYTDTWGILGNTVRLGYTQPAFTDWTLNGSVRYYWQRHANFYSDLFPYQDAQNFLARDRELAQFRSVTLAIGANWEFHPGPRWIEKGTINIDLERMFQNYQDFRNVLYAQDAPGTEPLYRLDATILQSFISFWY